MPELSAQLPAIIAEAAKSPLGIFALMIISLAILGFFFFKEASERTRIAIFVMLFVGVAVFGLSIVRTTAVTESASPVDAGRAEPAAGASAAEAAARPSDDPSVKTILGTWRAEVIYYPPRSFTESFEFEIVGDKLTTRATFLTSPRGVFNSKVANGVVSFEIPWQEIDGEVTKNVRNFYTGQIHPDRIDFEMHDDRGEPPIQFQARRAEAQ
jgi:hypothetical protein